MARAPQLRDLHRRVGFAARGHEQIHFSLRPRTLKDVNGPPRLSVGTS